MVRLKIFQRISKKFHESFGATKNQQEVCEWIHSQTNHLREKTLARRTVTLSKNVSFTAL